MVPYSQAERRNWRGEVTSRHPQRTQFPTSLLHSALNDGVNRQADVKGSRKGGRGKSTGDKGVTVEERKIKNQRQIIEGGVKGHLGRS